jgi:hypothetical protein
VNVPAAFLEEFIGAIQGLKDEVSELKATVASQSEEIAALRATAAEQKTDYEGLNDLRCQDFSILARRLNGHLKKDQEPGKTEITRAEKIEKYLLSQPGRRASYESLRGHLGIDKFALNDAINVLMETSPGRYGITRSPGDKRKRTLTMIPR